MVGIRKAFFPFFLALLCLGGYPQSVRGSETVTGFAAQLTQTLTEKAAEALQKFPAPLIAAAVLGYALNQAAFKIFGKKIFSDTQSPTETPEQSTIETPGSDTTPAPDTVTGEKPASNTDDQTRTVTPQAPEQLKKPSEESAQDTKKPAGPYNFTHKPSEEKGSGESKPPTKLVQEPKKPTLPAKISLTPRLPQQPPSQEPRGAATQPTTQRQAMAPYFVPLVAYGKPRTGFGVVGATPPSVKAPERREDVYNPKKTVMQKIGNNPPVRLAKKHTAPRPTFEQAQTFSPSIATTHQPVSVVTPRKASVSTSPSRENTPKQAPSNAPSTTKSISDQFNDFVQYVRNIFGQWF